MGQLQGKVVAVTGGARGIGEATARALAGQGANVVVGDLDAELAARTAQAFGGLGLPLDVSSGSSFGAFLDRVESVHGRVDGLVNNAGIMVIGRHLEVPLERQLAQLDVNLAGVINGCHEAAPRMIARGGGRIVNIASIAGRICTPGSAVYSATKAGVLGYTEALDAELRSSGVRVSAVLPGFTATSLIDGTTPPRGISPATPDQVAAAVVSLLCRYRPQAVVPRSQAPSVVQWMLMPGAARRWLSRKVGLDTMLTDFDTTARAAYERRVDADVEASRSPGEPAA